MPSDTNNMRFPKGDARRYYTNIKNIQYDDLVKQIYPLLYAMPDQSSIYADARISSLYSTSKVINVPGSEILSNLRRDGSP